MSLLGIPGKSTRSLARQHDTSFSQNVQQTKNSLKLRITAQHPFRLITLERSNGKDAVKDRDSALKTRLAQPPVDLRTLQKIHIQHPSG